MVTKEKNKTKRDEEGNRSCTALDSFRLSSAFLSWPDAPFFFFFCRSRGQRLLTLPSSSRGRIERGCVGLYAFQQGWFSRARTQ